MGWWTATRVPAGQEEQPVLDRYAKRNGNFVRVCRDGKVQPVEFADPLVWQIRVSTDRIQENGCQRSVESLKQPEKNEVESIPILEQATSHSGFWLLTSGFHIPLLIAGYQGRSPCLVCFSQWGHW